MLGSPGPLNSILDVEGLAVGHAVDHRLASGVSVVIPERPAVASVHVMGGAPGTRDTELLAPEETVERVDALVLSGGSAFGLGAASGLMAYMSEQGRGFRVGDVRVPIVPAAILFDLTNGGDKDWGRFPPYRNLGWTAAEDSGRTPFSCGSTGVGFGATTANMLGGLGTASLVLPSGHTIAAMVAVNAVGSATIGDGPHFWAAPFEIGDEFGGLGLPYPWPADACLPRLKSIDPSVEAPPTTGGATTLGIVATDAVLTKAQAKRLAVQAHDGFARALWPAHTPLDGDLIFTMATGERPLEDPLADMVALGIAAVNVTARAIARGVYAASMHTWANRPAWCERFGEPAEPVTPPPVAD
ncbi:MAG: P1 family peptidase [Hyphomicrobiales bacterium]|nr:P1 family peptidase [Hyphomicrobiales bacterium]